MPTNKLAFIGAGNMAQAIIRGLLKHGYEANQIIATGRTPEKLTQLANDTDITVATDNVWAVQQAEVIILGTKPQMLTDVMQNIGSIINPASQLIISLAAGVTVKTISAWCNDQCPLVRCMPNTPALVGLGACGLFANEYVNAAQKALTQSIMDAVGISFWLAEEQQIDAVTGVSGSGPAYYFLMMEAMIEGAKDMGLTDTQAQQLVLQTALGAATMAHQGAQAETKTRQTPKQLREAVTSPNGTTQRALESFADDNYKTIVKKAMHAAQTCAQELGTP